MQQTSTSRCKTQRLRRGLTLRQLADECAAEGTPIDYGQLGRIERGESTPRPALRAVLAKILELDVNDFEQEAS